MFAAAAPPIMPIGRPRCCNLQVTLATSAVTSQPQAPPTCAAGGGLLSRDSRKGSLAPGACARKTGYRSAVVPQAAAAAPAPAAADSAEAVLKGRSVAVVGGGPAGMLSAAHLAKLGGTVRPTSAACTQLVNIRTLACPEALFEFSQTSIAFGRVTTSTSTGCRRASISSTEVGTSVGSSA